MIVSPGQGRLGVSGSGIIIQSPGYPQEVKVGRP